MADKLKLQKVKALELINAQIQAARELIKKEYEDGDQADEDKNKWLQTTTYTLDKIFPTNEEIKHFKYAKSQQEQNKPSYTPSHIYYPSYRKPYYERRILALENIKEFLDNYDEPDDLSERDIQEIDQKFSFIKDRALKEIIKRDYQELILAYDNKSKKSILVLSGSILEAILLDKALANKDTIGKSEKNILEMSLNALKNALAEIDIEIKETDVILTLIKHQRNIIHPGREKKGDFKITEQDALAVFHLLEVIIKNLSNN